MIKANKPKTEDELRFERGEFNEDLTRTEEEEYERQALLELTGFGKPVWDIEDWKELKRKLKENK